MFGTVSDISVMLTKLSGAPFLSGVWSGGEVPPSEPGSNFDLQCSVGIYSLLWTIYLRESSQFFGGLHFFCAHWTFY